MSAQFYFVLGSDDIRVKERAKQLAAKLTPPGEWTLEAIDGWVESTEGACAALRKTMEALQTVGFFGASKLVWLKNISFLSGNVIGKSEDIQEGVEHLAELVTKGLPTEITFLVSALDVDKRMSGYKRLEKLAETEVFDALTTNSKNWQGIVSGIIKDFFADAGKRIQPDAVARMVDLCGADTRTVQNECEKVLVYAGADAAITLDHVLEMVSPTREESFWTWCDAVLNRQPEQALKLLRQLEFQQEQPLGLLANLCNHVRLSIQCKALTDEKWLRVSGGSYATATATPEGEEILAREGKAPHPFRLARVAAQAEGRPMSYWLKVLDTIHEFYMRLFENNSADQFRKLELLTFKIYLIEK